MKHEHSDIKIKTDIPTQDLEDLVQTIGATSIVVIGFYMAADTVRHIIKKLF